MTNTTGRMLTHRHHFLSIADWRDNYFIYGYWFIVGKSTDATVYAYVWDEDTARKYAKDHHATVYTVDHYNHLKQIATFEAH